MNTHELIIQLTSGKRVLISEEPTPFLDLLRISKHARDAYEDHARLVIRRSIDNFLANQENRIPSPHIPPEFNNTPDTNQS